jgi:predicted SAM-dependent methyltransferase
VIRLVVPDSEKYIRAYVEGTEALNALRGVGEDGIDPYFPNKYRTAMELFNTAFRQEYQHKWMYDYENLKDVLELMGFAEVKRSAFGESRLEGLAIDSPGRARESLYVEGVKAK